MTPRRISTTHGPRLDDELERETSALQHGPGARAQESREPEAPFAEEQGSEEDPVLARRELSRHLRMTVFPADRSKLVAEAKENEAPAWAIQLLGALPEGERFGTVYEIWDAVGGELEPGVHELLAEREHESQEEASER